MSRTKIDQETQIRQSTTYDDTVTPTLADFETNPVDLMEDLNNLRSKTLQLQNNQASGNWYDALIVPATLETGTARGVDDLNSDLHVLEKKRVLKCNWQLDSITGGAGQGVILGAGELPANTTAAIGAVTTLGTVVATATTFGTFSATDIVAGGTAIGPKNLVALVDAVTRDPILDAGGKRIYGLLQSESAVDGSTITDTTPNRVQISYVVVNGTGNGLELASAGEMSGTDFDYCPVTRERLEDLSEESFLGNAGVDVPSGSTVTRQVAYDNQGTTPVDLTTNATLDLEGAGLVWAIRDDAEATLFSIIEGSAGGTSEVAVSSAVDLYDNDAIDVDFASGVSANSGGTRPIDVGVTDGVIESTAGDLGLTAATEFAFVDGNKAGSTYAGQLKLTETSAEWDAYETQFGEVSIFSALVQAATGAARTKGVAVVTTDIAADVNVTGVGGGTNLDAQLPDYSGVTFVTDVDVYVNGVLMRNGVDAAANNDVYPGDTPANGDLKFEFGLKAPASGADVITVIVNGA